MKRLKALSLFLALSWLFQPLLLASPSSDPHEQHLFTVTPTSEELSYSEMIFPTEAAYAENLDQFLKETIEFQLERLWNTGVPEKARRRVEQAQEKVSLKQKVKTSKMEFKSEFDWSQLEYVTIIDFRKLKLEARYGITNDGTEIIIEIPGFLEGGKISFVNLRGEQSVMLRYEAQL